MYGKSRCCWISVSLLLWEYDIDINYLPYLVGGYYLDISIETTSNIEV